MSTPVLLGSTCAERLYLRERTNDRIRMIVSHVRSVEIRSCETGREMTTFGRGGEVRETHLTIICSTAGLILATWPWE